MKDIVINDGFNAALTIFDNILDAFALTQARKGNTTGFGLTSNPLDNKPEIIISSTACNKKSPGVNNIKNKLFFDDILDDVRSVIYNDPATIVTFSDGSKVCVKACEKDKFNKEIGLIYAIIKRLYANNIEKKTGYMKSSGLGEKINKIIKKAIDQKEIKRERLQKQKQKNITTKK